MIILVAGLLFGYWLIRTYQMIYSEMADVQEILESDYWWGRKMLLIIRTCFLPTFHRL